MLARFPKAQPDENFGLRIVYFQINAHGFADLRAESASSNSIPAAVAPAATSELPPELQAELDALQRSSWHPSATARASLGWRDNLLLSPFSPVERGFARAEIEALLLRPMRRHWEFVSFLNGDVLRYFAPPPETKVRMQADRSFTEKFIRRVMIRRF